MSISKHKIGMFAISREAIKQYPDAVKAIMGKCIILRAEALEYHNTIAYIAECETFDEIELFECPREYHVKVAKAVDKHGEEVWNVYFSKLSENEHIGLHTGIHRSTVVGDIVDEVMAVKG